MTALRGADNALMTELVRKRPDSDNVKLEYDKFKCVTPVIVVKGLSHECLIGMNVLVRWPILKDAITVLLKKQPVDGEENRGLSKSPLIARLDK